MGSGLSVTAGRLAGWRIGGLADWQVGSVSLSHPVSFSPEILEHRRAGFPNCGKNYDVIQAMAKTSVLKVEQFFQMFISVSNVHYIKYIRKRI